MTEYKDMNPHHCIICGKRLSLGERVVWVKPKHGSKFYVHTDCLKKEGAAKR